MAQLKEGSTVGGEEIAKKKDLDEHKAENATDAHNATNISFSHAEMQATNVKEGILEAFMLGNSTKQDLVDKLLLLDDSLPISYSSTWQEILTTISQISTGKKWMSGVVTSGSNTVVFEQSNGNNLNRYVVEVTGLPFTPTIIYLINNEASFPSIAFYKKDANYHTFGSEVLNTPTNSYTISYLKLAPNGSVDKGFKLPVGESSKVYDWIAFE